MIDRAKTVVISTTGGYTSRVTVKDSVMTAKSLRKILKRFGGKERENCFWFEDKRMYYNVIENLRDAGAFVN